MIAAVRHEGIVRRSAERVSVEWPALWDVGVRGTWNRGKLLDVSRFGAFVGFLDPVELPSHGDVLAILVEFGKDTVLVEGRVRWIQPESGVGIAFLPEDGELAETLVWELSERGATVPETSGFFRRPSF